MNELYVAFLLFAVSSGFWIIIYLKWLLPKIRNDNIGALERGEIKIKSEWLEEVIDQIVTRTRHLFLADLGQLAKQGGSADGIDLADAGAGMMLNPLAGAEVAESLLKSIGMKKPPAMLVLKVAQALGGLMGANKRGDNPPPAFPEFGE